MKKKFSIVISVLILFSVIFTGCGSNKEAKGEDKYTGEDGYKYYKAELLKNSIENQDDKLIVDIQVEEEFDNHHIKGAIATYSYPVKTDEDKAKLDKIFEDLNNSKDDIVIICPRGQGGAKRTYDYLKEKGIVESRLFILENGQEGWPYEELLEKK